MPNFALTDLTVRNLTPGVYFDIRTPAFGIRVGAHRKTWLVVRGRTRTKTVVGHYPAMSLSDARTTAKKMLTETPELPKPKALTFAEARAAYLTQHTGRPRMKQSGRKPYGAAEIAHRMSHIATEDLWQFYRQCDGGRSFGALWHHYCKPSKIN